MTASKEGNELIKNWIDSEQRVKQAQQRLVAAECEVTDSKQALGRWMMPKDAQIGETFCIWTSVLGPHSSEPIDNMLKVTYLEYGIFEITRHTRDGKLK